MSGKTGIWAGMERKMARKSEIVEMVKETLEEHFPELGGDELASAAEDVALRLSDIFDIYHDSPAEDEEAASDTEEE